jgi:hypothetical protein
VLRIVINLVGLCRRLPPVSVLGHTLCQHPIKSRWLNRSKARRPSSRVLGQVCVPPYPTLPLPGQTRHVESTQYMDCDGDSDGDIDTYVACPPN